jgi:SagB-type dehydrogenase family enzyme
MKRKVSRREFMKTAATAGIMFSAGTMLLGQGNVALAKDMQPIRLPQPQSADGNAFLKLLEKRQSIREYGPEPVPAAVLAGLLWAAFGINRPDGKRTAPSARNYQEIDIYVAAADGLYLYNAKESMLKPILAQDIRELTGRQPYVKQAPISLVYVADMSKVGSVSDEDKNLYPAADSGFISQNVYLYCAAVGLATCVRANIDKPSLAKTMGLRPDQKITLAQAVGYPKKAT